MSNVSVNNRFKYPCANLMQTLDEDTYRKAREREEVLKKLVGSQEVYIRELESK